MPAKAGIHDLPAKPKASASFFEKKEAKNFC
jgi:hypothetical protein